MSIRMIECKNGAFQYRVDGKVISKAAYEAALVVAEAKKAEILAACKKLNITGAAVTFMLTEQTKADREARPILMDFHLELKVGVDPHTGERRVIVKQTRPIKEGETYDQDKHFVAHSTARPVLEEVLDVPYGICAFEAEGKEDAELMAKYVETLMRKGWTVDGHHFNPGYAYYVSKGFILFIDDRIGRAGLDRLNLWISNSEKADKRAKRLFAPYIHHVWGNIIGHGHVPAGDWYEVELDEGKVIRILVADMDRLDPKIQALVTGMNICLVDEFLNKACTVQWNRAHAKGHYWNIAHMLEYDIWLFDVKTEVLIRDNRFFIGALYDLKRHNLTMDVQTMVNMGLGAKELVPSWGLKLLTEIKDTLFGLDEQKRRDLLATMVNIQDGGDDEEARWILSEAAKLDIGINCGIPALDRRFTLHATKNTIDLDRGRTPLPEEWSGRGKACPNPMMFVNDDRIIDLSRCKLSAMAKKHPRTLMGCKVYYVCCPWLPEGYMAGGRSPNAWGAEAVIMFNVHLPELMELESWGAVFVAGEDGDELMSKLNGGDFDDELWVISHPHFVRQVAANIAACPVEDKLVPKAKVVKSHLEAENDKLHQSTGDEWTWNVFAKQMQHFISYHHSLGSFINDLSRANLQSGAYLKATIASLKAGKYILPQGFRPPTLEELQSTDAQSRMLPDWFIPQIPVDYQPTKEAFIALCLQFMKAYGGPDGLGYRSRKAASNSDYVIDLLMQGAGDHDTAVDLIELAKESRYCPVVPEIIVNMNRMPGHIRKSGCYIMVRTDACEAIHVMRQYQEEILNEARRMEHVWKSTLPQQVLDKYPSSDRVKTLVQVLRVWRKKQFQELHDREDILKATGKKFSHKDFKEAFNSISNGWDELVPGADGAMDIKRHHGLKDFFFNMFNSKMSLTNSEGKAFGAYTTMMRRQIAVEWLNSIYAYTPESIETDGVYKSVSDGLPGFIFLELFDIFEELGMTGQVVFMSLTPKVKKELKHSGVKMRVDALNGHVFREVVINGELQSERLSTRRESTLPDGRYSMAATGAIILRESNPVLHSDRLAEHTAALAAGDLSNFTI